MTLLKKNYSLIIEEPLKRILVKQGSLWGISPQTAKKMIDYRFSSTSSGTRIVASSSLAPGWKNLTIIGSILAVILASLCWWISVDLENFVATHQPTSWSWLATSDSHLYWFGIVICQSNMWVCNLLSSSTSDRSCNLCSCTAWIDAVARETLKASV